MGNIHRGTIGRTGASVTQMGLGCAPLGDLFEALSETQAQATLQGAWDAGVRYFDTAPFYGYGKSEHRLGAFLREQPRNDFGRNHKVVAGGAKLAELRQGRLGGRSALRV